MCLYEGKEIGYVCDDDKQTEGKWEILPSETLICSSGPSSE